MRELFLYYQEKFIVYIFAENVNNFFKNVCKCPIYGTYIVFFSFLQHNILCFYLAFFISIDLCFTPAQCRKACAGVKCKSTPFKRRRRRRRHQLHQISHFVSNLLRSVRREGDGLHKMQILCQVVVRAAENGAPNGGGPPRNTQPRQSERSERRRGGGNTPKERPSVAAAI